MKIENLRTLIRESIQEYVKEIDEAAENAAMEARISKCDEAIATREAKLNTMEESEHRDLMDESKIKNLENEIKELKKAKAKFEKAAEKKAAKKAKKSAPKEEEEDVVTDAVTEDAPIDETDVMAEMDLEEAKKKGKSGKNTFDVDNIESHEEDNPFDKGKTKNQPMDENIINESFLKMQKLAGVITEAQYNEKKSLIESQLNEEKSIAVFGPQLINRLKASGFDDVKFTTNSNDADRFAIEAKKDDKNLAVVEYHPEVKYIRITTNKNNQDKVFDIVNNSFLKNLLPDDFIIRKQGFYFVELQGK